MCQVPESMEKVDYRGLRRFLILVAKSRCELLSATAMSCPKGSIPQLFSPDASSYILSAPDPSSVKFPENSSVDGGRSPQIPSFIWGYYCLTVADGGRVTLPQGRDCS